MSYLDKESQERVERLIPSSDAKVFRTSTGFVVRDIHDSDWCKFIPFDDLDKVQTKVAYRTLESSQIEAMESMPLPSMVPVSEEILKEMETEFEKICLEDKEQKENIEQHEFSETECIIDTMYGIEIDEGLTEDHLIQNQFGSLGPYIEDYTRDEFEVEEDPNAHLPSLSGASTVDFYTKSEVSPLSYQKTIFQENPNISEDFDHRPESLICASSEVGPDIECENDELPSSIIASKYEQNIQKRKSRVEIKEQENLGQEIQDLDYWSLIKQHMPPGLLLKSLITMITFLILTVGTIIEVHSILLFAIFSIFSHYGKLAFYDLKNMGSRLFDNYVNRRHRFGKLWKKAIMNELDSRNPVTNEKTRNSPLQNISIFKPDGPVSRGNKVKRTYRIEPVRLSEARIIKLNEDRPHVLTRFQNGLVRHALLDSGATCSSIHGRFLEELQKDMFIPTEEANVKVHGCIPGVNKKIDTIAYLSFQLETGHWIKNAPFIVHEGNYDMLIGSNLIRGYRWASIWKNQDCYIDLGHNRPLVPVHYDNSRSYQTIATSINEVVILPQETQIIELEIPQMTRKQPSPFKNTNLLTKSLVGKDEKGLNVIPSLTKIKRGRLCTAVLNKGEHPYKIAKGQFIAEVTSMLNDSVKGHVNELIETKILYNLIPRLVTDECHCEQVKHLEGNESIVQIIVTDKWGFGPTGCILNPSKPYEMEPGLHIMRLDPNNKTGRVDRKFNLIIVTDENGGLGHITKEKIIKTKTKLQELMDKEKIKPLYYFLDPLVSVSFTTRQIMTELWKEIPFSIYPIRLVEGHEQCVRPSLSMNDDELLTGINETKIHFQIGPVAPLENMLLKDRNTVTRQIPFKDANLVMFRNQDVVNFHYHVPLSNNKHQPATEASRSYYIRWLMSELRYLRVPVNMEISADGFNAITGNQISKSYYLNQLKEITNGLLLFPEPSARVFWPKRLSEEPPETVKSLIKNCKCALCHSTYKTFDPGKTTLYRGNINDLILKTSIYGSSLTGLSANSRVTGKTRVIIESICDIDDSFDTDVPLDPLELCPEDEMNEFLHSHPGFEKEDEIDKMDTSNLPPVQKSDPSLFGNYPMDGIPDHFRPGDWRKTDIMDRIPPEVPQYFKDQFGLLLDKHVNLISYYPDNSRPLSISGRPVVVDIELNTSIPIFMKPYYTHGVQTDMMDDKLTELLEKGEIHMVESKYNIAVIITHHNSSQKHVQGPLKKVRVCLDLRVINMLTKNKNIDSHLVTGIEQKKIALKGNPVLSSHDVSKAYRALVASQKLQEVTAFRCPSSRKYPNHVFAFKSAPDGLACVPGLYSRIINEALSPKARKNCISHIDDILVYSKTYEEHLEHLDTVYTDLEKCNFLLSASKIQPFQKEICFLGLMISGDSQWVPEDKKSYIDLLEPPKNKKQLQSLLGTANYLSGFIDGFQHCCGPLYDAMKGKSDKTSFQLNDVQMKAFHEIKRLIREAPKLSHLDTSQPIYMECDASLTGCGSVIYHVYDQPDGTKTKAIIRYGSKRWSLTESLNHTSLEREAMAIIVSCKTHALFLQACPEVIIKTDLKSLTTILSCYNNPDSTTMAKISHILYSLPYRWKLHHEAGANIPIADLLSRIHKPYECQFTDRRYRYPDLKRDFIKMPDEWKNNPDLILTSTDLIEAMRQQIMFIEKSSLNVKEKRLKSLLNEINLLYDGLDQGREQLLQNTENDIAQIRSKLNSSKKKKEKGDGDKVEIQENKLTAPPQRSLITPEFLIKGQQANPKLYNIIMTLRTKPVNEIPKKMLKNYRILNDSFLITRVDKKLPFDSPGNIKIVCDSTMTIQILSILHVTNCHYGQNLLNHVFQLTYKCINGSTQSYVKLVCQGCKSCQFIRATNKKIVPPGRIPFPTGPNQIWCVDFMEFKGGQTFEGKKVDACFNIMDLYSNFLISYLVKDQTAKTVIDCFKRTFAVFNSPVKILSDNASSICKNPEVIHFLKSNNVKQLATICSHNSKGNKIERLQKLFRETLMLVQETFKRTSQFEMFYSVIRFLNNRQLTLALHPNVKQICKEMNTKPGAVTPYSLQFGIPPEGNAQINLEDSLDDENKGAFRYRWQQIIKKHDAMLEAELQERQAEFNGTGIQVGDLVLISNEVRHKEELRYYKDIFEVTNIQKAKYFCVPLFKNTGIKQSIFEVSGNRLKKYNYSALFDVLPSKIRLLMGENLTPEQLKSQAENGTELPADLHTWRQWRQPNFIKLRHRITPPDKMSEPAMSVVDSDSLSGSSNESDLSIPDSAPDSVSMVSSVLKNNDKVYQLKTTKAHIVPVNAPSSSKNIINGTEKYEPILKPVNPLFSTSSPNERKRALLKHDDAINTNKKNRLDKFMPNEDILSPIHRVSQPNRPMLLNHNNDNSTINMDDSLGIQKVAHEMARDLISQIKKPIDDYLTKPNETGTPQKLPINKTQNSILSNIKTRLRDRKKILKPLRFRDPNFTK